MLNINQYLEELEQLESQISAAQTARIMAEHEAERAEYLSKATKSAEVIRFRDEGRPVAESEHKARTSQSYAAKKELELSAKLKAEKAKAVHQAKVMRRDRIKTIISAIQSSMKLV